MDFGAFCPVSSPQLNLIQVLIRPDRLPPSLPSLIRKMYYLSIQAYHTGLHLVFKLQLAIMVAFPPFLFEPPFLEHDNRRPLNGKRLFALLARVFPAPTQIPSYRINPALIPGQFVA